MGEIDVRLAKEGLGIPGNVARPYIADTSAIGAGAAELGRGVQRLGHDLDRLNARLATDRATKAGNLLVQRDIYVDGGDFEGAPGQAADHFEGLIHQTGENGLNGVDTYRDKFEGLRGEIIASQGLKGRELDQFNIQADAHFDRQMKRLIAHQKRQYDVVNDQVTDSTLATYQTSSVQGFKGEVADSDAEYTRQKDELAKLPVPATQAVTDEEGVVEVSSGDYHTMQSNTIQNNWNERWKSAVGNYNSQLQQGCDALEVRLMEKGVPKQTIADSLRKYREQSAQRLVSELVTSEDFGAAKRVVEEGDAFGLSEAQRGDLKKKVADSERKFLQEVNIQNRQAQIEANRIANNAIYDMGRVDENGKPRLSFDDATRKADELRAAGHPEAALKLINQVTHNRENQAKLADTTLTGDLKKMVSQFMIKETPTDLTLQDGSTITLSPDRMRMYVIEEAYNEGLFDKQTRDYYMKMATSEAGRKKCEAFTWLLNDTGMFGKEAKSVTVRQKGENEELDFGFLKTKGGYKYLQYDKTFTGKDSSKTVELPPEEMEMVLRKFSDWWDANPNPDREKMKTAFLNIVRPVAAEQLKKSILMRDFMYGDENAPSDGTPAGWYVPGGGKKKGAPDDVRRTIPAMVESGTLGKEIKIAGKEGARK